jgi:hypothetical protein
VVHVDYVEGYTIYDNLRKSAIGFKNPKASSGKLKTIWKQVNHAKSAFKLHTGVYFDEQTRFMILKK